MCLGFVLHVLRYSLSRILMTVTVPQNVTFDVHSDENCRSSPRNAFGDSYHASKLDFLIQINTMWKRDLIFVWTFLDGRSRVNA